MYIPPALPLSIYTYIYILEAFRLRSAPRTPLTRLSKPSGRPHAPSGRPGHSCPVEPPPHHGAGRQLRRCHLRAATPINQQSVSCRCCGAGAASFGSRGRAAGAPGHHAPRRETGSREPAKGGQRGRFTQALDTLGGPATSSAAGRTTGQHPAGARGCPPRRHGRQAPTIAEDARRRLRPGSAPPHRSPDPRAGRTTWRAGDGRRSPRAPPRPSPAICGPGGTGRRCTSRTRP